MSKRKRQMPNEAAREVYLDILRNIPSKAIMGARAAKLAEITRKTVPDILRTGAATYEERQASYGDNYKHYGDVMSGLFPRGLDVRSKAQWNRLGLVLNCVTKLGRYCHDIEKGHADSAHDLSVYAAMLEEMTGE